MTDPTLYSISVRKVTIEGEAAFQASVLEFPHVNAYGDTAAEAYETALSFVSDLIKEAEDSRKAIPQPHVATSEFSGRVTLRMPKSMHHLVARYSAESDVSLNQYIVNAVAYYTGVVERTSESNVWPVVRVGGYYSSGFASSVSAVSGVVEFGNSLLGSAIPTFTSRVMQFVRTPQGYEHWEWPEPDDSDVEVPLNVLIQKSRAERQ